MLKPETILLTAIKCLLVVGMLFPLHAKAGEEVPNKGAEQGDPYCLDSIDVLYVKNPDLALVRIDSLRRRCEANGWEECSRPRLEMINSIIYTYKEDPANTLHYAYNVLAVTTDLSEDNVFWRLMALQYISLAYSSSENWFMTARTVHEMETLAKAHGEKYAWYESVALMIRSQMLMRQGETDLALQAIDQAQAVMMRDTTRRGRSIAAHNRLDTEQFKADISLSAGRLEQSKEIYENLLKFVETRDSTIIDNSLYDLTRMRVYATLCDVCQQLDEPHAAALYYNKVLELQQKYHEGHSLTDPLSSYLFRSERYDELERLLLPILTQADVQKVITPQIAGHMQTYIRMLHKRGRLAECAQWSERYMDLNDSLRLQAARRALDEFVVAYQAKEQEGVILRQEHELFQQRVWVVSLIAFVGLLVAGIGIAFYLICKHRRNNRFLYERIRETNAAFEQLTKFAVTPFADASRAETPTLSDEQRTTRDVRRFLLDNNRFLDKQLSQDEVLHCCCVSHDTLNKRLNTTIGMSLSEYITFLRLDYACKLLAETNLTIDVVADDAGFNTTRTFLRQFKGKYNLSPTQYRKQQLLL